MNVFFVYDLEGADVIVRCRDVNRFKSVRIRITQICTKLYQSSQHLPVVFLTKHHNWCFVIVVLNV